MTLLDPTYASRFVPIIASVSEHQPPQWSSYIMDLHVLVALAPAGGGPATCVSVGMCATSCLSFGAPSTCMCWGCGWPRTGWS